MTVGDLKEYLEKLPDDAIVCTEDEEEEDELQTVRVCSQEEQRMIRFRQSWTCRSCGAVRAHDSVSYNWSWDGFSWRHWDPPRCGEATRRIQGPSWATPTEEAAGRGQMKPPKVCPSCGCPVGDPPPKTGAPCLCAWIEYAKTLYERRQPKP